MRTEDHRAVPAACGISCPAARRSLDSRLEAGRNPGSGQRVTAPRRRAHRGPSERTATCGQDRPLDGITAIHLPRRCRAPGAHPGESDGGQKSETSKAPEAEPGCHGSRRPGCYLSRCPRYAALSIRRHRGVLRLPPRRTAGPDLGRSRLRKGHDDGFKKSRADASRSASQAHQIGHVPQYRPG